MQAVSGIAGGTVVLCVLIGLFLCRQNKVNKKNRNRRPGNCRFIREFLDIIVMNNLYQNRLPTLSG